MDTQPSEAAEDLDADKGREGKPMVITRLAELPPRAWLNEAALAEALGVTCRTIRNMETRHELPPPIKFGGRRIWIVGRILDWVEECAKREAQIAEREAFKVSSLR